MQFKMAWREANKKKDFFLLLSHCLRFEVWSNIRWVFNYWTQCDVTRKFSKKSSYLEFSQNFLSLFFAELHHPVPNLGILEPSPDLWSLILLLSLRHGLHKAHETSGAVVKFTSGKIPSKLQEGNKSHLDKTFCRSFFSFSLVKIELDLEHFLGRVSYS